MILFSNGIEGPIGKASYLSIWPINELIELNQEYAVDEFLPGIKYFGSDGEIWHMDLNLIMIGLQ